MCVMKLKSITFRCSSAQFNRLETVMRHSAIDTRTMALSCALEEFLAYAERSDTRELDLFALVEHVDRTSTGPRFSEQA